MRADDKYDYRRKKTPYRCERTLIKRGGISLKEEEFYDGKRVRWCLTEDYDSISNGNRYSNTTPLFDNVTLPNGNDKIRYLFQNTDYDSLVVYGKLGKKEVLCEVNFMAGPVNSKFVDVYNINGKDAHLSMENKQEGIVRIDYKKDGFEKIIFYDCKRFEPCSDEIDALYANGLFIKSYIIDGKIRIVFGDMDLDTYVIKPYGYDVSKKEFFKFPYISYKDRKAFAHYDLIDNSEMKKILMTKDSIGCNKEIYKNIDTKYLANVLSEVGLDYYNDHWIFVKLKEVNGGNKTLKKQK